MALLAKVLTVSDTVSAGSAPDRSGPLLAERLTSLGFTVVETSVVEDGVAPVRLRLRSLATGFAGLVVTTGGTGFGPNDLTPEATADVIERTAPGLAEAARSSSPLGALSRGVAGTVGSTLVLNLPGSPAAVTECLDALAPILEHAVRLTVGEPSDHPTPAITADGTSGPGKTVHDGHSDRGALTHVDERGHARMVDVSAKPATRRLARASCRVSVPGGFERVLAAGTDVGELLGEARLAGIQGAKETASLVPLCHPLALAAVSVELEPGSDGVAIEATVETVERTGVEMEALAACTMAALSVVGACRRSLPPPSIEDLVLDEKVGGRSGHWRRPADAHSGDELQ